MVFGCNVKHKSIKKKTLDEINQGFFHVDVLNKFLIDEKQKGKQINPQDAHKMPVHSIGI